MALKKLKDYGLTFKAVKDASLLLNKSELVDPIPVVGIKGEELLSKFCTAIDAIPDDVLITKDYKSTIWYTLYESIPQEFFDDDTENGVAPDEKRPATTPKKSDPPLVSEGAEDGDGIGAEELLGEEPEPEPEPEPVIDSDCPTFQSGWDPAEEDCNVCATDFPEEHDACKLATEKKAAEKKAGKKSGKPSNGAGGTTKKAAGKRTRYGHMPASMAGHIDDMVYTGTTKADMVQHLMDQFNRDKKKADSKVSSHLLTLTGKKGITIVEIDGGILKADEEYTTGQDETNTISSS